MKSALAKSKAQSGYALTLGERDNGSIFGSPSRAAFEVSPLGRLRIGLDMLLFNEQFPGTAIDSTRWVTNATTMTLAVDNQIVNMNSGSNQAAGASIVISTRRAFPMWGGFTLWADINLQFSQVPVRGNVCEFGFFAATGTAKPTYGCFFRLGSDGRLRGVVVRDGAERETDPVDFASEVGFLTTRNYIIGVNRSNVTFWVDDVLVGSIELASQFSAICIENSLPFSVREYNQTATLNVQQMRVGAINITAGDYHGTKAHDHIMAGMGSGAYQNQSPTAPGSTSNLTNSTGGALPAAAVPTNTTAALGTGLGGWFFENETLAANIDGIISSYQVPVSAALSSNKTLYITGVLIESFCISSFTGGGYTAFWTICFGHTSVSLATAGSATSRAARRQFVGMMRVPSGVASTTKIGSVYAKFNTPIIVEPGEFIQTVKRKAGTAPSGGTTMHGIAFDGYFE
jgi:hypothetical protein